MFYVQLLIGKVIEAGEISISFIVELVAISLWLL